MPFAFGYACRQAGQTKTPDVSVSKRPPHFKQRKISPKSADRGDCTGCAICICLQKVSWFFRRQSHYGPVGLLLINLQQNCGKGYGKIREELVRFRGKQRSDHETYEGTMESPNK